MKVVDLPWTAVTHESAGARKAALVLHALSTEERRSIMADLLPSQRDAVEPLLAELAALGLPRDRALVEELLAASVPENARVGEEVIGLVDASADDLRELLGDEPPGLLAALLNARDWPWREAFIAQLRVPVRRQAEEALQALRSADPNGVQKRRAVLEAALLRHVEARLVNASVGASPRRTASRLGDRVRRLLRRRSS